MATFNFSKGGITHAIPLTTQAPTEKPYLKMTKGSSTLFCALSLSKGDYDIKIGNYYLIGEEITNLEGWTIVLGSNPDTVRQNFYITHIDFREEQTVTDKEGQPIISVIPETKTYNPGEFFTIRRASNGVLYDSYTIHTEAIDNYYQVGSVTTNKDKSAKRLTVNIGSPIRGFTDVKVTQSEHQTIYVSYNGVENTVGFTRVPVGAVVSARVVADEHYSPGGLNGSNSSTTTITLSQTLVNGLADRGWTFEASPAVESGKYNITVSNTDTNQRLEVLYGGNVVITDSGSISLYENSSITVTLTSTNADFKKGDLMFNGTKVATPFTLVLTSNATFTTTSATEAGGWKPDTLRSGEVLEIPDLITTVDENADFSYWNNQLGVPQVSTWENGRDVDHVIEFNVFVAGSTLKESGGNTSLDWMEVGIGGIRYSQTLTGVSTDPNGGALPLIREQLDNGVLYTTYLKVPACVEGDTTDSIGLFAQGEVATPCSITYRVRWSNITNNQTARGTITRGAK